MAEGPPPAGFDKVWVQVADVRKGLARASANFHGNPSRQLNLVGITGTNGKTSTAYLVESILKTAGHRVGVVGTIEYRGPQGSVAATRTTPESHDLQELFAGFLAQRCAYAVIEVSSHALALERVHACRFRSAVFTNLTPDHLDFHGTLDRYFEEKKKLFLGCGEGLPGQSVVNLDDPRGRELVRVTEGRSLTFAADEPADCCLISQGPQGGTSEMKIRTPAGEMCLAPRLVGRPNVSNILAAVATCYDLGISPEVIRQGVEACPPIPGRFENIECGQPFRVIVDYAHTPDALEKVLKTARELTSGKVLLLFGCGGERDRLKRPLMGQAAEKGADFFLITSDNPRSEDPEAIIAEIAAGISVGAKAQKEPDRETAIRQLLGRAKPGDVAVLAGKGHEIYQVLKEGTIRFDDREIARIILGELGFKTNPR
jgi:UDP-N-acetylmuramoyl-L-alanyl-D-glutamate--2,6-diaminopimelate ligase